MCCKCVIVVIIQTMTLRLSFGLIRYSGSSLNKNNREAVRGGFISDKRPLRGLIRDFTYLWGRIIKTKTSSTHLTHIKNEIILILLFWHRKVFYTSFYWKRKFSVKHTKFAKLFGVIAPFLESGCIFMNWYLNTNLDKQALQKDIAKSFLWELVLNWAVFIILVPRNISWSAVHSLLVSAKAAESVRTASNFIAAISNSLLPCCLYLY